MTGDYIWPLSRANPEGAGEVEGCTPTGLKEAKCISKIHALECKANVNKKYFYFI